MLSAHRPEVSRRATRHVGRLVLRSRVRMSVPRLDRATVLVGAGRRHVLVNVRTVADRKRRVTAINATIGVDLGQAADFTAIAVTERLERIVGTRADDRFDDGGTELEDVYVVR